MMGVGSWERPQAPSPLPGAPDPALTPALVMLSWMTVTMGHHPAPSWPGVAPSSAFLRHGHCKAAIKPEPGHVRKGPSA